MQFTRPFILAGPVAALLLLSSQLYAQTENAPTNPPTQNLPPQAPVVPTLSDPKVPAGETVPRFVDWASRSGVGQRENFRKAIEAASGDTAVANELCREISESRTGNHSRTLVLLSVLGEMRNPEGEKCLTAFIHLPFPVTGTLVNGEILEQTSLGMLQAKAVDGLAYARTETGDREVLWAAGSHPSRIVRAEAISAYLWNRQDSESARATLIHVVRPDERDFLDRPRHGTGQSREEFNRKLALYAEKHPAPAPNNRPRRKLKPEEAVADPPQPLSEQGPPPPQEKK